MLCIQYPSSQAYLQSGRRSFDLLLKKMPNAANTPSSIDGEFSRGLGLFDSTMLVVGLMIGSGIFIVSAEMSRNIGSAGWLLMAWAIAGGLTIAGALCY